MLKMKKYDIISYLMHSYAHSYISFKVFIKNNSLKFSDYCSYFQYIM